MEAMRLEVGERQRDIGDKSLKCSLKSDKMEEVVGKIADALTMADHIQFSLISKELPEWRRRQQVACIGGPNNTCLDQLQSWFTSVAESLKQVQQQLRKLQELVKTFTHDNNPVAIDIGALEERAVMQLNNLLASALVVERQPCNPTQPQRPLVIMQIVQFTVKLRFLLKLPELDGLLKVKVSLDEDAVQYNTIQGFRKFNIVGSNTRVMNMEESNGNLTAEFRHLHLREMKCSRSRSNEFSLCLFEELHTVCFETQLEQSGQSPIILTTTSLPIVVATPIGGISNCFASVLWYNMLCSEPKNVAFFLDPPTATWSQLSEVLSWQFSSQTSYMKTRFVRVPVMQAERPRMAAMLEQPAGSTSCRRGLDSEQLSMLGEKLLGQSDPEGVVTWTAFCKTHVSGRSFSFWTWLDSILVLIKRHLLSLWNDGCIMGFVSKERGEQLLREKSSGTFLLRFSESQCGGIAFTWVEQAADGPKVRTVEPCYTGRQLSSVLFADILRDYKFMAEDNHLVEPLVFLYPNIPKDNAFGRYYNQDLSSISTDLLPVGFIAITPKMLQEL
ncbi:signal transducer and activator of transcription 1-like [Engraulis encrasicolus]|uniref:signal transducer and activator of transcription 1-like n=1 Tax=Engraulis encrasicolus TaxID=184585 RepID=UPI002FCF3B2E